MRYRPMSPGMKMVIYGIPGGINGGPGFGKAIFISMIIFFIGCLIWLSPSSGHKTGFKNTTKYETNKHER